MQNRGLTHSNELYEVIIGFLMMFLSWFTVLLIAIDYIVINDPGLKIIVLIILYMTSLMGLILATYGLFTIYVFKTKRRKQREIKEF